ncbi:hypothetical protein [Pseudoalteromonas sp.]|uniref:hypothetical protein n=1 Tax=Pseudoalteromonas sp. TaxID=53249 RepID=UPI00272C4EB9|nr:hypothetical protein [Pseudoalteromonas sp.]
MEWPTIDVIFSYSLNKLELVAFIIACLLALYPRKSRRLSVAISAGVMSFGLGIGDVIHVNVLGHLTQDQQIYFWYLVWALFSLAQAFLVVWGHWFFGVMFSDQVKLVFITMALNAFLNTLMFIDRNIFALNFNERPNEYSDDSWLLWDVYSIGINSNLLFLAFILFSRGELKGKYVWMFLLYCCCFAVLSL